MTKWKPYWLSYDLGVGGDYESLYQWLDNHHAKICGDSLAYFKYPFEESEDPDEKLKADLLQTVDLRGGNKLYLKSTIDGTAYCGYGDLVCCAG